MKIFISSFVLFNFIFIILGAVTHPAQLLYFFITLDPTMTVTLLVYGLVFSTVSTLGVLLNNMLKKDNE